MSEELVAIDGVGKVKLENTDSLYKLQLLNSKKKGTKPRKEASTYKETLQLYKNG
jgi:ATP-dependent DNA helicase RecQ